MHCVLLQDSAVKSMQLTIKLLYMYGEIDGVFLIVSWILNKWCPCQVQRSITRTCMHSFIPLIINSQNWQQISCWVIVSYFYQSLLEYITCFMAHFQFHLSTTYLELHFFSHTLFPNNGIPFLTTRGKCGRNVPNYLYLTHWHP